jgi:hypothetical protein
MSPAPIHLHIENVVLEGLPTDPGYAERFAVELRAALITELGTAGSSPGPGRASRRGSSTSSPAVAAAAVGAAIGQQLSASNGSPPAPPSTSLPAVPGHRPGGRGVRR